MKRRLLLILAAVQRPGERHFRLIKYSQFPPLSLMTIAGLTPDDWDITVRDEHVESSEVDGDFDLVGIQTYISSAPRAYELADRWRRRGAKVVLGGLHPTSLPEEAAEHADAVCIGPAETVWGRILDDFEHGRLQTVLPRPQRRLGRLGADPAARPDEPAGVSGPPHDGHLARLPALRATSATRAASGGRRTTSRGRWPRSSAN